MYRYAVLYRVRYMLRMFFSRPGYILFFSAYYGYTFYRTHYTQISPLIRNIAPKNSGSHLAMHHRFATDTAVFPIIGNAESSGTRGANEDAVAADHTRMRSTPLLLSPACIKSTSRKTLSNSHSGNSMPLRCAWSTATPSSSFPFAKRLLIATEMVAVSRMTVHDFVPTTRTGEPKFPSKMDTASSTRCALRVSPSTLLGELLL
jgi:hypothetical protein